MTEASIITMQICEDFVALRREVYNGDMGPNAVRCDSEGRGVLIVTVGGNSGESKLCTK